MVIDKAVTRLGGDEREERLGCDYQRRSLLHLGMLLQESEAASGEAVVKAGIDVARPEHAIEAMAKGFEFWSREAVELIHRPAGCRSDRARFGTHGRTSDRCSR